MRGHERFINKELFFVPNSRIDFTDPHLSSPKYNTIFELGYSSGAVTLLYDVRMMYEYGVTGEDLLNYPDHGRHKNPSLDEKFLR